MRRRGAGVARLADVTVNGQLVMRAALAYAALGLPVFPLSANRTVIALCPRCKPGAGCPGKDECRCGTDTCHGFYAATTDRATITKWFTEHPDWQLGLRTGKTSGLVVLDVDLDKGGLDSLIALQKAGLDIRGTAAQLSGSGQSFHLFYGWPGYQVPNSSDTLGGGLDVRGDGGFVVVAPSHHPSTGARYELLGPLTDLPPWSAPAGTAPPATSHDGKGAGAGDALSWVAAEPDQEMCLAVQQEVQRFVELMSRGAHHQDVLAPVQRLLRLRQQGHLGVAMALQQAQGDFVQAMSDKRSENEARTEFQASVSGAWQRMTRPRDPKQHAACSCQRQALRKLVEAGVGLSKGIARTSEVRVMRHLLMRADQQGTWLITGESQRTIAQSIDVHQPTVSKVLKRLADLGFMKELSYGRGRSRANDYLLTAPDALKELSIEVPEIAGTSIDNSVRASVHRLFGAGGLSGSVADTFGALSEWYLPFGRGRLIKIRRESPPSPLLTNPYVGKRQIPQAAAAMEGRTVAEIAAVIRRSPSTVRKHLKRLEQEGMAFCLEGRWWRTRFDPEALADELDVADTAERKRLEYLRQRRVRFDWQSQILDRDGEPILEKVITESGHAIYVSPKTGEIMWQDPDPRKVRKIG
jgi:DNA-binding MarR family transcriptional regulator